MKPRNFKRWTKALRSGQFKQAHGRLVRVDGNGGTSFCALGVAAVVAGDEVELHNYDWATLGGHQCKPSPRTFRSLGLKPSGGDVNVDIPWVYADRDGEPLAGDVSHFNDTVMLTFPQIADLLDYFGPVEA